jgi:DNA primase
MVTEHCSLCRLPGETDPTMSPQLPRDIVARIKEETDLVGLVREYVTLRVSGAGFVGLCPFHNEKTPSFHVDPRRQYYKCFGCGEGGDAIAFLMNLQGMSFPEALELLARPLNVDLARYLTEDDEGEGERQAFFRAQEAACELWVEALWSDEGRGAREYLLGRGFSEEILRRYDVGWAPAASDWLRRGLERRGVNLELALRAGLLREGRGSEPFAYFRSRVIFPIRNIAQRISGFGGRIIGEGEPKYLNSSESPYFNKRELLYGFSASRIPIARHKTAILVEGYLDLIALAQAGFGNVVATCGTAFTEGQATILRRGCRLLLVLFDGDAAGVKASVKAAATALAAGLEPRVGRLPAGEDPDSFLKGRKAEDLAALLDAAPSYLPLLRDLAQESGKGRTALERAVKSALQTVATVEDPIRREYLLAEAAAVFGLEAGLLRGELEKLRTAARPRPAAEAPTEPAGSAPGEQARDERTRRILGVLWAHAVNDDSGVAARFVLETLDAELLGPGPDRELLSALRRWRTAGEGRTPAAFLDAVLHDGTEGFRQLVAEALTDVEAGQSEDRLQVVKDCIARLRPSQGELASALLRRRDRIPGE